MARVLVIAGLVLVAIGVAMMAGFPFGRLPGDFVVRRGSMTFYFPLTTSLIVSGLLTLLLTLFRR